MTMDELISRLEGAEDFDREADREIGRLLLGWKVTEAYIETDERDVYPNHHGAMYPSFTESVDAAISLAERLLPGWRLSFEMDLGSGQAYDLYITGPNYRDDRPEENSSRPIAGKPPALAICLATLQALRALSKQEEQHK